MLPKIKPSKKLIYLDHAAATPMDPAVRTAMAPFMNGEYGNPSALYSLGRSAAEAIAGARLAVSEVLSCRPEEIIFTAGGTESINLAILGVVGDEGGRKPCHVIASALEHEAVLECLGALRRRGHHTTLIGVDGNGFVDFEKLKKSVRPETVLISIMHANNEVGTIQPISKIGKWLSELNGRREGQGLPRILFHTDACQAAGSLDSNVKALGVDLLSANGSKIYGPRQTGFLYVRSGVLIKPVIFGGGQERGLRSGTENTAGAVGFAAALKISQRIREKENARLGALRDFLIGRIRSLIPDAELNGPAPRGAAGARLPGTVNFSFPGAEGEAVVLYLDSYRIAASTGSACASGSGDPSHVLLAMGRSKSRALEAVRFTMGRSTKKPDLLFLLKVLPGIVAELRRVRKA